MKSILLGMAVALVAGTAFAADMSVKAPPPPVAPAAPTWTGTYVGLNGGYGWGTSNQTDLAGITTGDYSIKGGLAGVTYGGNWQAGSAVLGFESDLDWADISGRATFTPTVLGFPQPFLVNAKTNMDWIATGRARLGFANGNWLFYVTGGAVVIGAKTDLVTDKYYRHYERQLRDALE